MSDLPESNNSQNPLSAEPLTSIEARVLGCLIEKQATTPETYPLTLNAVVLACNQKTSREPVLNLNPGEVGHALRSLEGRGLSRLVMGSRADRWEQRTEKQLELVHRPSAALIAAKATPTASHPDTLVFIAACA